MPTADIHGAQLAWQQLGEGPDIVLVHGLAANRAFWFGTATALSRRFRVTLFDLRGHGYSSTPRSGYSASAMGDDLLALMDLIGIDHAILVGHSYGGAATLEAATKAPARCSRLALLDTRVQRLQPEMRLHDIPEITAYERAVADVTARIYGYDWETETQIGIRFLEATARLRADGHDAELRDSFTPFGEGRGAVRAARRWLTLLDETNARSEFLDLGASADEIAALRCPTLLMYAAHSRCQPSGAALSRLLPHAQFETVPDAGHFFPISSAALVIDRLDRFAARSG